VHISEHVRGQPRFGEGASVRFPRPPRDLADSGTDRRVTNDDELPRLAILGARRERRRGQHSSDERIVDVVAREPPVRTLPRDNRKEVVRHESSLAPTRRNELTYMMRRPGPHAHALNAAVFVPPIRSMTSGVIDLNAHSGSSVSIS